MLLFSYFFKINLKFKAMTPDQVFLGFLIAFEGRVIYNSLALSSKQDIFIG